MDPKSPAPVFEIVFEGEGIYPEEIPLGTLSRALSAVQRIAGGDDFLEEEKEEEDGSLRLLGVRRGSAVFKLGVKSTSPAVSHLRLVGKVLANPEEAGQNDFLLRPIEQLSTIARSLNCSITIREARGKKGILAKIEPSSYESISGSLLVKGETSFVGKVQRVGGATDTKCGLRVGFQHRMLICKVARAEVARKLGEKLYQEVVVHGTAHWLKNSWRLFSFKIQDISQPVQGSLIDAFDELRKAGGKAWDTVEDPTAYLEEVCGER